LIELISAIDDSVDGAEIEQLIVQRNRCGVALLLPEVAIIHARVSTVHQLRIALCTCRTGIKCAGARGEIECPVRELSSIKLVVLILAAADDPTGYLRASSALTSVCREEGFLPRLLSIEDPLQAWRWFESTGQRLPEYVTAHDIMYANYPRLRDTDNLSDAIDAFCCFGVSELPVVDEDGDLLGVVSEDELIKLGLPEYITWMEDLSPILNFEPFAEILRREAQAPVFEIMAFADRYATIDDASPAIQATKLMARRNVRQVYVMKGKKLVGVISIQDLIQKVLRA
jgi:predicted transcriptional regulator